MSEHLRETVVLVHGLWLTGAESTFLRRRLRALGLDARQFRYRSVSESLDTTVQALHRFVIGVGAPVVHLVGHSLGGLVVLKLDECFPDLPPGRRVLLASPVAGSRSAERIAGLAFGRRILGRSVHEAVLGRPGWRVVGREVGVIAGSRGIGLGRLFTPLEVPHDGTVAVTETRLVGAAHRLLPVTHLSLLFDRRTAAETVHFLVHGRFIGDILH
ncbi:alpha/beta hydrolase [soil metagenome]